VVCVVKDKLRADQTYFEDKHITILEADFLKPETFKNIPIDIDVAYYLIHSMSNSSKGFESLEAQCAENFKAHFQSSRVKQVIYLSGITNEEKLSKHLQSRKNVEHVLKSDSYAFTVFKGFGHGNTAKTSTYDYNHLFFNHK